MRHTARAILGVWLEVIAKVSINRAAGEIGTSRNISVAALCVTSRARSQQEVELL